MKSCASAFDFLEDVWSGTQPGRRAVDIRSLVTFHQIGADGGSSEPRAQAALRRGCGDRTIGILKQCRSIATRVEKLGASFLAMITLTFVQLYLRTVDSSDTA